jgi:hypothetical protein
MAKIAFSKKAAVFTCKLGIFFKEETVKCNIWSIPCLVLKLGHFGK